MGGDERRRNPGKSSLTCGQDTTWSLWKSRQKLPLRAEVTRRGHKGGFGALSMFVTWVPGTVVVAWWSRGENPLSCILVKYAPLYVMLYADSCSSHNAGKTRGAQAWGRELEKCSGVWREAEGRDPRADPGAAAQGTRRGKSSTGAEDTVEHGVFYRRRTGDTAHLSPSRVSTWASSKNALIHRSLKKKKSA